MIEPTAARPAFTPVRHAPALRPRLGSPSPAPPAARGDSARISGDALRLLAADGAGDARATRRPAPETAERVASERFGGRDRSVLRRLAAAADAAGGTGDTRRPAPEAAERVERERFGGRDRSVLRRLAAAADTDTRAEATRRPAAEAPERVERERFGGRDRSVLRRLDR